jgi:hypothetical protein
MIKKLRAVIILFLFFALCFSTQGETKWYRTQAGTGIGNCGPTCVSMAIAWSTQKNVPVETIRDFLGYQRENGATDFMELALALREWKAIYDIEAINNLSGLKELVKRKDMIVIVLINTSGITTAPLEDIDIFGKNYDYEVGHYIILTDVISNYFEVQDPLPGGSDRRYKIQEVWDSMKDRKVILIRNLNIRNV